MLRSNDPNIGYNMTIGGDGGRMPEEVLHIISEKQKLYRATDKTKQKQSIGIKKYWSVHEKIVPEYVRIKISETLKRNGIKPPKHVMYGEDHPMFGKHHTPEARKKISDARKGKCFLTEIEKHKRSLDWLGNKNINYVDIDKNELKKLLQQGLPIDEISKILGICYGTIFEKTKKFWNLTPLKLRYLND